MPIKSTDIEKEEVFRLIREEGEEVNDSTWKYYHQYGLLPSSRRTRTGRNKGVRAYYDPNVVDRFLEIMVLKRQRFSLKEIRKMLESQDPIKKSLRDIEKDIDTLFYSIRHLLDRVEERVNNG